jgi:ribose transport system ATP-binding protein
VADQDVTPIISATGLSKTFGGRTVLNDLNLKVMPGEVHGLVGQNGSGKSTFIKILAGYHEPDDGGALQVCGNDIQLPLSPGESHRIGMSFVHQDLGLIEDATVLENVRIGRYDTNFGWWISWRSERRKVREMLERFGIDVSPTAVIADLPPVDRAMVAIARALEQVRIQEASDQITAPLLVLDEPTPHLPRDGVDRLFKAVRDVAAAGVGILFVTHRLDEVLELTDRVTVLRDGRLVETYQTEDLTEPKLIEGILGFSLERLYPSLPDTTGDRALKVENLSGGGVEDFALEARRGEIIGVTGLIGMGWESVPYLLFGAEDARSGRCTLGDKERDMVKRSPREAIADGFALVPADRHNDGALLDATVAENITLATLGNHYSGGFLRKGHEVRRVRELLDEFDVRPRDPHRPLGTLSGGNQQKAVIAKWFETKPEVLLVHEPTQGVDVGARAQIFQRMRDAADDGVIVIYATAEWEDLAHLCKRVLIFRNGRVASELSGGSLTAERIAEQSFSGLQATAEQAEWDLAGLEVEPEPAGT